eukprot:Em0655g3a
MKIPDSQSLEAGTYRTIREPWRTEWDIGVQSRSSQKKWRSIEPPPYTQDFRMPSAHTTEENTPHLRYVQYDLDDLDLNWLERITEREKLKCQQNMAEALTSENALSIEYDESTVCDVCKDKESEDTNEMIFCDVCNVCVHQACYGIATVPEGEWICKPCLSEEWNAKCVLCPNTGGALKRVRPGNTNWAHLSCALWIPEVRVGNVDKMEPITNVEAVPRHDQNSFSLYNRTMLTDLPIESSLESIRAEVDWARKKAVLLQEDGRPKLHLDPVSTRHTRSKAPDHHGGGADCIAPPINCALSNHTAELPCVTRTLRARDYHCYDVASPTTDKNYQQVGTKRKLSERELNSPPVSDSELLDEPAHNLRHRLPPSHLMNT